MKTTALNKPVACAVNIEPVKPSEVSPTQVESWRQLWLRLSVNVGDGEKVGEQRISRHK